MLILTLLSAASAGVTPQLDASWSTDDSNLTLGATITRDNNLLLGPVLDASFKLPLITGADLSGANAFDTLTDAHLSLTGGWGFAGKSFLIKTIGLEAALGAQEVDGANRLEYGFGLSSYAQSKTNIAPQLTASWRQEYDDLSGERSASVVGRGGLIGLTGLGGEGGAVGLGAAYNLEADLATASPTIDMRGEGWLFFYPAIQNRTNLRVGVAGTYTPGDAPLGVLLDLSLSGSDNPLKF